MLFETIMMVMLAIFALIGLACIIRGITRAIFCTGLPGKSCILILLDDDAPDVMLRASVEQISYQRMYDSNVYSGRIYAVDCGIPAQMRDICCAMCYDAGIEFICENELPQVISRCEGQEEC